MSNFLFFVSQCVLRFGSKNYRDYMQTNCERSHICFNFFRNLDFNFLTNGIMVSFRDRYFSVVGSGVKLVAAPCRETTPARLRH
jgi:hypothetical protein